MNIQSLINNAQNKKQLEGFLAGFIASETTLDQCTNEDVEIAVDEIMVSDSFMDYPVTVGDMNRKIITMALSICKDRLEQEALIKEATALP